MISFEEFVFTIGFDKDPQPSGTCYQHETEDGLVLNLHRTSGSGTPTPEELARIEAIARKLVAQPFEGMEQDEEAGRLDKIF